MPVVVPAIGAGKIKRRLQRTTATDRPIGSGLIFGISSLLDKPTEIFAPSLFLLHGVKFRGLPATAHFGDVAGPCSSG